MSAREPAAVDMLAQVGAQLASGLEGGTVPRVADGTGTVVTGTVVPGTVVTGTVVPGTVVTGAKLDVVVGPGGSWPGVTEPVALAGGPGHVMAMRVTARAPANVRDSRSPTFELRRAKPETLYRDENLRQD